MTENGSNGKNGNSGAMQAPPKAGDPTGRYIVVFREGATQQGVAALTEHEDLAVSSSSDPHTGGAVESGAIVFEQLGVAVVSAPPERISSLMSAAKRDESPYLAIEPERYVQAFTSIAADSLDPLPGNGATVDFADELPSSAGEGDEPAPVAARDAEIRVHPEYLLGFRDSISALTERLLARSGAPSSAVESMPLPAPVEVAWTEDRFTWGLQATRVNLTDFGGRGVRIAVLDTGFGPHPDFRGRALVTRSFVAGQAPADGHGHGTHCIGTSTGPLRPGKPPRYGIAHGASIFAGKVLSNSGSGTEGAILEGINWAIVSMSLGRSVGPGDAPSAVFEIAASRALRAGTLIIAAAGNDSDRTRGIIKPVSHPANCPSILAVGALTKDLKVANFSNGGINPNGGEVNIAAPGVDVYSSIPRAPFYTRMSGTSMATPHVAGIAALYAERTGARGTALKALLERTAQRLPLPVRDVGAGLVRFVPTARPADAD